LRTFLSSMMPSRLPGGGDPSAACPLPNLQTIYVDVRGWITANPAGPR
jgi:hypothetical protein